MQWRTDSFFVLLMVFLIPVSACSLAAAATSRPTPTVLLSATPSPQPSMVEVGDTITAVDPSTGEQGLSMTLLSCQESSKAVNGYSDGYYTFTAKPDMKFLILKYRLENRWIRKQESPYMSAGEVKTDKGYYYKVWSPPLGVLSEEYSPRKATEQEAELLGGDSGGQKRLLPEESVTGRVVFEIPQQAIPIEIALGEVSAQIRPTRCTSEATLTPSSATPPVA